MMSFQMLVRHASRASFTLRPINFKHNQISPSNDSVPVISAPVTPKKEGKGIQDKDRKIRGKEWIRRSSNSRQEHLKKDDLTLETSNRNELDSNTVKEFKRKYKKRQIMKNANQYVEENLRSMGINVCGEIIYGIFPVLLALQGKRRKCHRLIYKNGSGDVNENIQNILNVAGEEGIQLTSLKPTQFKKVFQGDQVHQGVCCDVSPLPLVPLDEGKEHEENTCQEMGEKRRQLWLYLDQIHDPMNFGSVLRSAYFMGVDRVITSETCRVGITSTVSKASAGVAEFFPVHQVKDPVKLASSLSHVGWDVVSSASAGGGDNTITTLTDVTRFNPKGNVLLIVGNEGKGISPELRQTCHTVLTIEPGRNLHPHLHCLNVSVATALLLHTLRQRQTLSKP